MSKSNFQRPNKSQISISNDPNKCAFFLNLSHCDLFVFCHLKFGIFHTSIRASSSIKLAAFRARGEAEPFFPVPPSAVCRPPSTLRPLSSAICRPPSAVRRLPSIFIPLSTLNLIPYTLHLFYPSTASRPPSAVRPPPSPPLIPPAPEAPASRAGFRCGGESARPPFRDRARRQTWPRPPLRALRSAASPRSCSR